MQFLTIAVCTRLRPKMLAELLQSCTSLMVPSCFELRILVVESGPEQVAKSIVEKFQSDLSVTYFHQPEIGVVRARNMAIDAFLATDSAWLGFIDDDEVLSAEWLAEIASAIHDYPDCNIFAGGAMMIEPETSLPIFQSTKKLGRRRGQKLRIFCTQNVVFKRSIFAAEGRNARFDMRLNTVGGSDVLLSVQLSDRGESIRYVPAALSMETIPEERATFKFRTRKLMSQGHHAGLINLIHWGWFRGHILNLFFCFQSLIQAVVFTLIGGVVLVFNEKRGLWYIGRAVGRFYYGIGRPKILWRRPSDIYHVVQGY